MRIAFIGCVQFSYEALSLLLKHDEAEVCAVITRRSSSFNSDFADVGALAESYDVPVYYADENPKKEQSEFIRNFAPDIIYCFGWSHLLSKRILDIPPKGTIGFHPAALPRNRGRHPLIWALVLGLEETASTFFVMDEGADSGPLVSQEAIPISRKDTAKTLYEEITKVALIQIDSFTNAFSRNTQVITPQDHTLANSWRKRSIEDGIIDWRMSAQSIYNLVRALSPPYPGAQCIYEGEKVNVWEVEITPNDSRNCEPGKVLDVSHRSFTVKCGDEAISVIRHDFDCLPAKGDYL